jgi:dTDP-4-dehydrorhamnose 3,5-epimerase
VKAHSGMPSLVTHFHQGDKRGSFDKIFPLPQSFEIKEAFYSKSVKGVIRGMHLQHEPFAVAKIIKIIHGKVVDVLLDCRQGCASYGSYSVYELDESSEILIIPKGYAHGFQVVSESATMLYFTDGTYNPVYDSGYRYDSFGYTWPLSNTIISDRDLLLPTFEKTFIQK